MRHVLSQNPFLVTGLLVSALCFALPLKADAQNMQGGTYQVQGGTFGTGGTSNSSSANYQQQGMLGEPAAGGESTSESYRSRPGTGGTFQNNDTEDQPTISGGGRSNRARANGTIPTTTADPSATSTSVLPFTPSTLGMPTTPLDNRDTEVDFPTSATVDDARSSDRSEVSETNEPNQDSTSSHALYLWLALALLIVICFMVWKRRKAKG